MKIGMIKASAIAKYGRFDATFYLDTHEDRVAKAKAGLKAARKRLRKALQYQKEAIDRIAKMKADGDLR